jgi:hypothetical protein
MRGIMPEKEDNDPKTDPDKSFDDKVKVYTAPSGTQYIDPVDLFLTSELFIRIRQRIEERQRQKGRLTGV